MKYNLSIAIVGRTNVGKSTLFNRIIKKKKALVSDMERVTRDRNIEITNVMGHNIRFVDTGGFEVEQQDNIGLEIIKQIKLAVNEANVIFFVVDGQLGLSPYDKLFLSELRKQKNDFESSTYLLVNKIDDEKKHALRIHEFYELGLENIYKISAEANHGINELLKNIVQRHINSTSAVHCEKKPTEDFQPRLVVMGKPNVGKSSFVNKLLGENRVVVNSKAGTTRDPVEAEVSWQNKNFILIDTAGMRKRSKVTHSVEKLSIMFAERSIEKADIAMLILDGTELPSDQDIRIAEHILNKMKPFVIAINKTDLFKTHGINKKSYENYIKEKLHFLNFVPIVFISVKEGKGLKKLFNTLEKVGTQYNKRIKTSELNRFFKQYVSNHAIPIQQGKRPKIYYLTQGTVAPPSFIFFSSYPRLIGATYKKYLENKLREHFNFEGCPIKLIFRKKT